MLAALREAVRDAWSLLMPVECAGCQRHDLSLCKECAECLIAAPTIHATPRGLRTYAAVRYEGRVRRVILAFKNQHRTDQARPLSQALLPALRRACEEAVGAGATEPLPKIVIVPTSKRAFRARGYHPVSLVLRAAGIRHARVLRVAKETSSQKLLGIQQRATNVDGAFVATRWLGASRVIIVDDVLTTGATIDEAARAVSAAGGTVIAAVTIGFTPRTGAARDIASGEGYGKEKGAQ
ncbi:competence protein F [marine actinobacterium PHSC20C1]|nr:competence protein F [marine actinobacterium PHSC20C1]